MANKIASQLDILTANFHASVKGKCTFRMESSTHHSQKMLSYQYHLAEEIYYFAVLTRTVHKCEVNQHIGISLWFSESLYSFFSKLISGRGIIWYFTMGLLMTSLSLKHRSGVNMLKFKCTLHSVDYVPHLSSVQDDISLRLSEISVLFWSIGRV